ncbi:MAG: hypothetical protein HYR73_05735 [Candidatus Eisenbacteria bacterium]|nr:hypothetical protein [Candidatus Eisenbacteria bacterium]
MSDRLHHGCLRAGVADVVDLGVDVLPHFELAAIPVLDGHELPAELPMIRRRLRAEGIRATRHRGALLLKPGELDRFLHVGMLGGSDELYLCAEWADEFEPFPGRISSDFVNFNESTPLGLEEWMVHAGCMLALGDGQRLNFATPDRKLADRLRARFEPVKG